MYSKLVLLLLVSAGIARADELTLARALAAALENNPELAAFAADIRAADAQKLQAAARPNPELSAEVENIGADLETTIQLSQLVELGGKRAARQRAAGFARAVADADYAAKRLKVFHAITDEFIAALGAQRRLAGAEEAVRLTEKFAPSAARRVEAGAASQVERLRFDLQIANTKLDRDRIKRELIAAQKRLSTLCGVPATEVTGDLEALPAAPAVPSSLALTPALRRWEAETARREAVIRQEANAGTPDVTVSAGYRHFHDESENAAVVGISIPLPLFNRNQGAVAAARADAEKASAERRAVETQLNVELQTAFDELAGAQTQLQTLKETILPQAREAFAKVNDGYLAGKFTYLEVVDAQNTLLDANVRYLDALVACHRAIAKIESLTAEK